MMFKPAAPFDVRGPWSSGPFNPYPWQAAYYSGAGWVYSFSRSSGADALRQARAAAAEHQARAASN